MVAQVTGHMVFFFTVIHPLVLTLTGICIESIARNTSWYHFIRCYVFQLQLWSVMRPFINVDTGRIMYCIRRSYAAYNFLCISLKRHDDGSQLEPKHLSMNKLIKTCVVCDWFNKCTCYRIFATLCKRCAYKISYKKGSNSVWASFHEGKILGRR